MCVWLAEDVWESKCSKSKIGRSSSWRTEKSLLMLSSSGRKERPLSAFFAKDIASSCGLQNIYVIYSKHCIWRVRL